MLRTAILVYAFCDRRQFFNKFRWFINDLALSLHILSIVLLLDRDQFLLLLAFESMKGCPKHKAHVYDQHQSDEQDRKGLNCISRWSRVANVVALGKADGNAKVQCFGAELDHFLRGRCELMFVANQVDHYWEWEHNIHSSLHRRVIEEKDCRTNEGSPSVEEDQDVDEWMLCSFVHTLTSIQGTESLFWFLLLQRLSVYIQHDEEEDGHSVYCYHENWSY